jgi:hypothetical protein
VDLQGTGVSDMKNGLITIPHIKTQCTGHTKQNSAVVMDGNSSTEKRDACIVSVRVECVLMEDSVKEDILSSVPVQTDSKDQDANTMWMNV